jgi:hypothetical protein
MYRESVALFRGADRDADAVRVLQWWASSEARNGNWQDASVIIEQVLPHATGELEMWAASAGATIYWAMDARERASELTRWGLELAGRVRHPLLLLNLVSYVALMVADDDPQEAARFFGYADARQQKFGNARHTAEREMFLRLHAKLLDRLNEETLDGSKREGAAWSDEQAYARAKRF